MAGEFVAQLGPASLQRETSLGNNPGLVSVLSQDVAVDLRGVGLAKFVLSTDSASRGYTAAFRIPANLNVGTGLTFQIYLTDDGANPADLGKKVNVGITVKRLAAGQTISMEATVGTEQLVSVTLSSTAAAVAIGSLAIANANLDSAGAGDLVMIRVRRKADATNDTCPGRPILLRLDVQNT